MNRPGLTAEIHQLAHNLTGFNPQTDRIVQALLAIHHTDDDAPDTSTRLQTLAGETSVLKLLALVLGGMADSKPVNDLPADTLHATKAALHQLVAELLDTARSGAADDAAYELDPA